MRQKVGSHYHFPCDSTGWLKGNKTDHTANERTSNAAIHLESGFYALSYYTRMHNP